MFTELSIPRWLTNFLKEDFHLNPPRRATTKIFPVKSRLKTVLFWYINSQSLSFHINYCFVQIKQKMKREKKSQQEERKYKSSREKSNINFINWYAKELYKETLQ